MTDWFTITGRFTQKALEGIWGPYTYILKMWLDLGIIDKDIFYSDKGTKRDKLIKSSISDYSEEIHDKAKKT